MANRTEYELAIQIAGNVEKSFNKAMGTATDGFEKIGSMAKKAAGIAAAAFGAMKIKEAVMDAVDVYSEFETSMANTAAISQASAEDYAKLEQAARDVGKATTKSASECADALGYMALAGWDTEKSVGALNSVVRLSEATHMDLATASDQVTDSMSALGIEYQDLGHYLDVATMAGNKSNQTTQQMMEAFISAGLTLDDMGDSIENVAGLYGMMANRGTKASDAGTVMKAVTVNIKKNAKELEKYGISAYDAEGNFRGLTDILQEVTEKQAGMSQQQKDAMNLMIAGKNHIGNFNKILEGMTNITEDGRTEFEALTDELNNSKGALDKMADTATDTLEGAKARFSSAMDDMKINMVKKFAPYAKDAINAVANAIPNMTENLSSFIDEVSANAMPYIRSFKDGLNHAKDVGVQAFQNIKTKLDEHEPTIQKVIGVVNDLKDKFELVFTTVQPYAEALVTEGLPAITDAVLDIVDAATDMYNFINDNWSNIAPIVMGIVAAVGVYKALMLAAFIQQNAFTIAMGAYNIVMGIATGVSAAFGAVMAFVTSPIFLVAAAIGAVIAIGILLYKNWDLVKEKASQLWSWLVNVFENLKNSVVEKINSFAQAFPTAFGIISGYVSGWIDGIKLYIEGIKQVFNGIIEFFTGVFTGDWEKALNGLKDIAGGIFKMMASVICTPFNAAIGAINGIIDAINGALSGIKVPDWVPGLGGQTFDMNIPHLPQLALAEGGIATGPTNALIGEGGEPEAVIPLSKLADMLGLNKPKGPQPALAGGNGQIMYAPVYNFYGGNPTKEDMQEAEKTSQAEFNRMMKQWMKDNDRKKL